MFKKNSYSEIKWIFSSTLLVFYSFIPLFEWHSIFFLLPFFAFIYIFEFHLINAFFGSLAIFIFFYLWISFSQLLSSHFKLDSFFLFLQEKLDKVIANNYQGKVHKFISYLLLNKKDKEVYFIIQDFRDLSLVHLIVISGFHMNVIKSILSKLLPNFLPPKIKKVLLLSSLLIYSWATAFSIPSTRIFFEELSEISFKNKRKTNSLTKWSKSIWITFLIFPFSLTSLSFVLSYFFALVFRLLNKLKLSNINELVLKTFSAYLISLFFFSFKTKKLFLISGLNQFLFTPVIIFLFLFYLTTWPFKLFSGLGNNLYEIFINLFSKFHFNKLYLPRVEGSFLEIYYFLLTFSLVTLGITYLYK